MRCWRSLPAVPRQSSDSGAARNIIVIQGAEWHGATLGFIEFARIAIPLACVNLAVYWIWPGL